MALNFHGNGISSKFQKRVEDILSFVLNTKRPLSDIWLLSYKQNSFGCFFDKIEIITFA